MTFYPSASRSLQSTDTPIAFASITVRKNNNTLPMRFVVFEFTFVLYFFRMVPQNALAAHLTIPPLAFVFKIRSVDKNPSTILLAVFPIAFIRNAIGYDI